jgi:uncharacterized membrane protein
MWISMAIFWALVIIGVLAAVSWITRQDHESPDALLDRRFAAGEIDEAQYRTLRDALHKRPHGMVSHH